MLQLKKFLIKKNLSPKNANPQEFPGGPLVKNLLCNAGDMGLIPGWGTKIQHAGYVGATNRVCHN